MMTNFRLMISAACLATLAGCVTVQPTKKGDDVQLFKESNAIVNTCEKLGPLKVEESSGWGVDTAVEDASIAIRNKAAEMNADAVLLTNLDVKEFFGSARVVGHGIALRCFSKTSTK